MNKQEPIIITKVSNGYYIKPLSSIFGDGMGGDQDIDVEMMIFRNINDINAWMVEHFEEEEPIPAYDHYMDMDTNKPEAAVLDLYGFVICMRCGKAYMGDDIESCCPDCEEAIDPANVKPIEADIVDEVQDEIQYNQAAVKQQSYNVDDDIIDEVHKGMKYPGEGEAKEDE